MSDTQDAKQAKRRVHHFAQRKSQGEKITVVTAYDYPTAVAADAAQPDAILVGDSLGMVALGLDSTIPVTLDMMVHHTSAVRRGVNGSFLIADLPFLTYHQSAEISVLNAGRLVQTAGAEAVKLEGGTEVAGDVRAIVRAGIPVMGHIGLVPQSVHQLGGYRVQGKGESAVNYLVENALAIQEAGAFALVLEGMKTDAAAEITSRLSIPTIGIGAGRNCDGQVLVISDILGMLPGKPFKFVKQYANLNEMMSEAVRTYCDEVRAGTFPEERHEYR